MRREERAEIKTKWATLKMRFYQIVVILLIVGFFFCGFSIKTKWLECNKQPAIKKGVQK